jgi:poly(A) polymerase
MITPEQQNRLNELISRKGVKTLFSLLNRDGEELRIVGGAVRNALMDHPVSDIDCATTALPQIVLERAQQAGFKAVPTGIDHGTITLILDHTPYEITTLREDVLTNGRHAQVLFGRDFAKDALRRDFTINALFLSEDGTIHDTVGGVKDASEHIVRFIGDPETRIREDYLRILRFFRFSSAYGTGVLERKGLYACIKNREGLEQLSRERIQMESFKLLMTPHVVNIVMQMSQSGLSGYTWGAVTHLARLSRVLMNQGDVISRLAALSVLGRHDVPRLRDSLRLSNAHTLSLERYAHCLEHVYGQYSPLNALDIHKSAYRFGLEATHTACIALHASDAPLMTQDAATTLERLIKGMEHVPVFPITGGDLIASGIPKGPEVSTRLKELEQHWLDAGMPNGDVFQIT